MKTAEIAPDRTVLRIGGADRVAFLQGLVTNDVTKPGLIWAALLTPQGKYLFDFFLLDQGDAFLLDVKTDVADALIQRLSMYRLRADVTIEADDIPVARGLGDPPETAQPDPRHPDLGWRAYGLAGGPAAIDWDAIRVTNCIPDTGVELISNDSYPLESGFERLNGVDFRKGCYVGQEVTARMKHKTELRKGLARVAVDGQAPVGSDIAADGKPAGRLFTQAGGHAIAYLRFDRAKSAMHAGDAVVTLAEVAS
ncbi:MAG: folate-binding protein [Rhodobacteraceae bacterium]|nr:folate-binding protein [Paracoccaceae bacterium]